VRELTIAELSPWIEVRFDCASGPGGQNVNKVATRAALLFDFAACPLLDDAQRERLRQRYATRLARDGRLRIVSQRERSQATNRLLSEQRLLELLTAAFATAKPRKATRPTRGSQRYRVAEKRRRGEVKQQRRSRPGMGD